MRKYLFIVLALLLTIGVANAASIPVGVDPKNNPIVWTEAVYNGSGSTITSSYIVSWDFDTSNVDEAWDDDMCNWVKTASEADDIWTAGVLPYGRDLANGDVGSIIIRGPAYVRLGASATVNQLVGAETDGQTVDYAAGTDDCALGRVIKAAGHGHGPEATQGSNYPIVFVDVSCSD